MIKQHYPSDPEHRGKIIYSYMRVDLIHVHDSEETFLVAVTFPSLFFHFRLRHVWKIHLNIYSVCVLIWLINSSCSLVFDCLVLFCSSVLWNSMHFLINNLSVVELHLLMENLEVSGCFKTYNKFWNFDWCRSLCSGLYCKSLRLRHYKMVCKNVCITILLKYLFRNLY